MIEEDLQKLKLTLENAEGLAQDHRRAQNNIVGTNIKVLKICELHFVCSVLF